VNLVIAAEAVVAAAEDLAAVTAAVAEDLAAAVAVPVAIHLDPGPIIDWSLRTCLHVLLGRT